jgi:structural maintenance of chromosomes protein 6
MTLRVKHKFSILMSLRDYSAEIEVDNQDQLLELKVIPRDAQLANAVSNTKSLSGGERSYSTVAFLISLWSCVEHPFYFLDEYDVFSDEHNRHMMTMLLFNEAKKKADRQYGFLTPLDFSNIEASDTITIHKLQDPERNS